jgi:hypothetical protein
MGEMRERMLRGELYNGSDADSAAEFARAQELLAEFNGAPPGAWDERAALLRRRRRADHDRRRVPARHARAAAHRDASHRSRAAPDRLGVGRADRDRRQRLARRRCNRLPRGEDRAGHGRGRSAVVTKDLPAGVVAVGVPARILREIGDEDRVEVPASPARNDVADD